MINTSSHRSRVHSRLAVCCSLVLIPFSIASTQCAHTSRSNQNAHAPSPPPPVLLAVDAFHGDFSMRQNITVRWGKNETRRFEAVLEKQGAMLTLVALGPMSTVGFVITHTAKGVSMDNRTGHHFPFPPEYIIADIQRVFYPWATVSEINGAWVKERVADGRLMERRFSFANKQKDVVISYQGWARSVLAPHRVVVYNEGYELLIETLEVQKEPAS